MSSVPSIAFNTAGIVSLLVGFVLPNLVGIITNESMNKGLKSAILAGCAAVSAVLSQWVDALTNDVHFMWQSAVLSAAATWLMAEGSYLKIWKPTGVSDIVQGLGITDKKLGVATGAAATDAADDTADVTDQPASYVSRHAVSASKIGVVQSGSTEPIVPPPVRPSPSTGSSTPSPIEQATPEI